MTSIFITLMRIFSKPWSSTDNTRCCFGGECLTAKLQFLGTGAADWGEPTSEPGIRRFSSAMLDEKVLIDPGPHIFKWFDGTDVQKLFGNVECVIVTHSHGDHFCAESLERLAKITGKLTVVGNNAIESVMPKSENIMFRGINALECIEISGYRITALPSNHYVEECEKGDTFHYLVTAPDGKKLFYGLDGAWLTNREYRVLRQESADLLVLDCTCGDKTPEFRVFEHNTIPMVLIMVDTLKNFGALAENGKIFVSHLARTLHEPHDAVCRRFSDSGVNVAYDGLTVKF